MNNRVLLVDDDPNVLSGFRRQLRKNFTCETAESGQLGLDALGRLGPFAVVVSDMRMPGMDGVAFLSEVERRSPETIRIMLTGNADLQTCIDAVNAGHIFRFLTKPCEPECLATTLEAGIRQYQLIQAERELLHGTVTGCIRTLTDILGVVSPAAFGQGVRVRRYVRHMAAQLNAPSRWEYEMAAALCHIGCVALPPEILARVASGRPLTNDQRALLANHPSVGCQLLAEIPRLKIVALVVEKQRKAPKAPMAPKEIMSEEEIIDLGAQMLRIALDLDALVMHGEPFVKALATLQARYGADFPLIEALMSFENTSNSKVIVQIAAAELTSSMAAAEEIRNRNGEIIVAKGQRITGPLIYHLQACVKMQEVTEPFSVEVLSELD